MAHKLPLQLLETLQQSEGFDEAAFIAVHERSNTVTSVRINPSKINETQSALNIKSKVPWCKNGYYLEERPSFTFDPLLHAGAYYVQDASSMFLEQALQQTCDPNEPLTVLDLCAAPGGKSTHIQSLLNSDSVLISNEVIRNRVTILAENITKWGAVNTIVTNNDPADFTRLENMFDAAVVDAPCSGSGLFRKDTEAINEWSLENVRHCSMRQQRILTDVWPALKPGGVLIYSTCSYSTAENEMIADWLSETTNAESIPLTIHPDWGIVVSESSINKIAGYRFYPYKLDGEGFYLACFRKRGEEVNDDIKKIKYQADKKIIPIASKWLCDDHHFQFYQHKEQVFAMPEKTLQLFLQVQSKLNVRKAGFKVGDCARDEIIPDHALALTTVYNRKIETLDLAKEDAIQFLRRTDFSFNSLPKGWLMITYKSLPLGWIKSLGNRINNYYPKEWRIRN